MNGNKEVFKPYFDDPRLMMTFGGRALVRFSFYVGYFLCAVLTVLFLLSDTSSHFFYFGLFLLLFLFDRILHIGEAENSIRFIRKHGEYNVAKLFLPRSFAIVEHALDRALLSGEDIRSVFLLKLIDDAGVARVMERLEINKKEFVVQVHREFSGSKIKNSVVAGDFVRQVALQAFKSALRSNVQWVRPLDIWAALSDLGDSRLDNIFSLFGISRKDGEVAALFENNHAGIFKKIGSFFGMVSRRRKGKMPHRVMNRAWTARPTPYLDAVSTDLTDLARAGHVGFLVGHEAEYARLLDTLSRPGRSSVLLVGEPGMGKEAIVGRLAYDIVHDDVPPPLFDKRLVSLSIGSMVAGAGERGELESRTKRIAAEIVAAGNIILYIPDIDNLAKTSGEGHLSVADVFLPAIRAGTFPVIGATYPREYKRYVETQSDFVSTFEMIRVLEINESDTTKILTVASVGLEEEYAIVISLSAIKKAVTVAKKYFRARPLPGSAEEILKEALAEVQRVGGRILLADTVVSVAERKANIPMHRTDAAEAQLLLDLETIIHRRFVDQDEAVGAVARSLREYRSGLTRRGGPIASFLFVGPTGVGKTELSKLLAELQFGSAALLTRFDMSEYQDRTSIFRLIGSPDGTIAGALTDAILAKPYSVVLLDEFEKASSDVLNLFLQVLDDGRLTDNLGRLASFENSIIIATSNAESEFVQTALDSGVPFSELVEEIRKRLSHSFKPELLNRFSDIIIFKPLTREDVQKIAELQLKVFEEDVLEAQNITIKYGAGVIQKIAELGFSASFGARPLRKVISEKLRGVMAEKILRREFVRNDSVEIDIEEGDIVFRKTG